MDFSNNFLINFGRFAGSKSVTTITYPKAYSVLPYVLVTNTDNDGSQANILTSNITITNFHIHCKANGTTSSDSSNWISIGF